MNHTLIHLTAAEQTQFLTLPEALRQGWTVEEEILSSYEPLSDIQIRYSLVDFTFHPEMKTLAERIANGETPDKISLDALSPDVQSEIFFVLGARGTNVLIQSLFSEITTDADIELLAMLTVIRHKHLELNSSVPQR